MYSCIKQVSKNVKWLTDLRRTKPVILLLHMLHILIPFIEELVLQQRIIHQIPLSTCVVVATVVSLSREVQPLWVTELISYGHEKTSST